MDLNHLHLHVREVETARRFYETLLGFREKIWHGDVLFLTNDDGFDLALAPDTVAGTFPPWFHFGFRLASPDAVRALHARMSVAGVPMRAPLFEEEGFMCFRCADPDGHQIEVYWE